MKAEKSYNIKFVSIDMISKSMEQQPFNGEEPQDFKFDWIVDLRVSEEQKLVAAITDIAIVWVNGEKEIAKFKTVCAFEFPDFANIFTLIEEKKYDVPVEIEIFMKSTALTTSRGMLYSELKGTYLNGLVLPLVDIAKLVRDQRASKEQAK